MICRKLRCKTNVEAQGCAKSLKYNKNIVKRCIVQPRGCTWAVEAFKDE